MVLEVTPGSFLGSCFWQCLDDNMIGARIEPSSPSSKGHTQHIELALWSLKYTF